MAWKRSWQSGLELQVLTAMLSFIFGVGVRIILSSDFHGVVPRTWNQLKQTLSELHAHLQKTEWFVSLHQICVWTWETTGWCFQQLHKKGVFPIVWVLTIWWFLSRVEGKSRMHTERGSTAFLSSPQLSFRWNRQENKLSISLKICLIRQMLF